MNATWGKARSRIGATKEQIDQTQAKYQEMEQQEKRRAAIIQQKGRDKELTQAEVNRLVETAKGYKRQAKIQGDSYLEQKKNEAAQIKTSGMNEVEAMKKRIAALNGPGGEALLRLDIAKALAARQPRFLLLNSTKGSGNELGVTKIDTNELINQAGLFEALREDNRRQSRQSEGSAASSSPESPNTGMPPVLEKLTPKK